MTDKKITDLTVVTPVAADSILITDFSDSGHAKLATVSSVLALGVGYSDEQARDAIGTALVAGTGIAISVNDGADTITITSTVTPTTINDGLPAYVSGRWYLADRSTVIAAGSGNIGLTKIRCNPLRIGKSITVNALGALLTSSATGNFKLAVYAHDNANSRPIGAPLGTTGDISTISATEVGAALAGSNFTLDPGLYWTAVLVDNASCVFAAPTNGTFTYPSIIGNASITSLFGSSVSGSLAVDYTTGVTYAGGFGDLTSVTPDAIGPTSASVALLVKCA